MSDLRNNYQAILKELENHFQDENEKNYVIEKVQELSMMFMDVIDRLTYITDMRIKEVEEKQKDIENKISTVQKAVDGIENDIYEGEESYEFEIICPYCNYEFISDINSDTNTEVECPECHNIIELDWNAEDDGCSECSHHCAEHESCGCDSCDEEYDCECEEDNEDDM